MKAVSEILRLIFRDMENFVNFKQILYVKFITIYLLHNICFTGNETKHYFRSTRFEYVRLDYFFSNVRSSLLQQSIQIHTGVKNLNTQILSCTLINTSFGHLS